MPPKGEDDQVWRSIQHKEVLDFLQFDDGPYQREVVSQLVDVLLARPRSRYRACCVGALQRFARQGGDRSLAPAVLDKFRTVLEIPEANLFRDDPRLDVILDIAPPNSSVEDHIASWSRQSQVPLSASAALDRRPWSSSQRTFVLRDEIGLLGRCLGASWSRQGDGYVLSEDGPDPIRP